MTEEIRDWNQFDEFADESRQVGHVGRPYLAFRGHSREYATLFPTLARGLLQTPEHHVRGWLAEQYVRDAIVPRMNVAGHGSVADRDRITQETLMRHYGAPSRLLDWTLSPFVALFFACAHDGDEDGELWRASVWATGEARHTGMEEAWRELQGWFGQPESHEPRVVFFVPPDHTARSSAQQCLFSVSNDPRSDHKLLIAAATDKALSAREQNWRETHGLKRLIIPKNRKREFLEQLYQRNVHAASLFPDIEGLCRFGGQVLELTLWKLGAHLEMMEANIGARVRATEPPAGSDGEID